MSSPPLSFAGGEKVLPFWKHYYSGAEAVLFVVDSASSNGDMERACAVLGEALEHPALQSLPCLFLASCQDKPGARTADEVSYRNHYNRTSLHDHLRIQDKLGIKYKDSYLLVILALWLFGASRPLTGSPMDLLTFYFVYFFFCYVFSSAFKQSLYSGWNFGFLPSVLRVGDARALTRDVCGLFF